MKTGKPKMTDWSSVEHVQVCDSIKHNHSKVMRHIPAPKYYDIFINTHKHVFAKSLANAV